MKDNISNRGQGLLRHFYAPNFEKEGSILVSACQCVCPSVPKKFKLGF